MTTMTPLPRKVCLSLLFHFVIITSHRDGVAAIRAVTPPVSTAGVWGQEAEFSCSVADKSANEILTWQLEWDAATEFSQSLHLRTGPNDTTFSYDGFFTEKHATYTTRYIVNGSIHTSVLHLTNIQPSDEGSVACVYQLNVGGSLITRVIPEYQPVRFTVWKLPSPTCAFNNLDPNVTSFDSATVGATVELTCEDTIGIPTPELTWNTDAGALNLSSTTAEPHLYRHELQPEDNGRWFHCEARSAATPDPIVCSVRPMMVRPIAEVKPEKLQLMEGAGNIEFTCTGRGLPEIVSYQWFINGMPTYAVDHETFSNIRITNNEMRESNLSVEMIYKLGKTVISCEVTVQAGFTGRANGAVIIFMRDDTGLASPAIGKKSHQTSSEPFKLSVAPSALAIIFGVISLLTIIAVALFMWHRRHRHLVQEKTHRDTEKLSPSEAANGAPPRHTKRFWAYMVTTV